MAPADSSERNADTNSRCLAMLRRRSFETQAVFLARLRKFHIAINGKLPSKTFPPVWRGKPLDLYGLYTATMEQGGMDEVVRGKKWQTVWTKIRNYDPKTKCSSLQLKLHYLRYLYVYEQKTLSNEKIAKLGVKGIGNQFGDNRTSCSIFQVAANIPAPATTLTHSTIVKSLRMPPRSRRRAKKGSSKKQPVRKDDCEDFRETSPVTGGIRLPYKRPFYNLALSQPEIEQDLALISNFKRRRATRGNHHYMAVLDDMSSCAIVLLRLKNHELGSLFNLPVTKSCWPKEAKELYNEHVDSPLDLGTIQARLSCGEYTHSVLFADDVRSVFRNAAMCAPAKCVVQENALLLWKMFEEDVALYGIAATEPVLIPPLPKPEPSPANSPPKEETHARKDPMKQPPKKRAMDDYREPFREPAKKMVFLPVADTAVVTTFRPRSRKVHRRRQFISVVDDIGPGGSVTSASDLARQSPDWSSERAARPPHLEGIEKLLALEEVGKALLQTCGVPEEDRNAGALERLADLGSEDSRERRAQERDRNQGEASGGTADEDKKESEPVERPKVKKARGRQRGERVRGGEGAESKTITVHKLETSDASEGLRKGGAAKSEPKGGSSSSKPKETAEQQCARVYSFLAEAVEAYSPRGSGAQQDFSLDWLQPMRVLRKRGDSSGLAEKVTKGRSKHRTEEPEESLSGKATDRSGSQAPVKGVRTGREGEKRVKKEKVEEEEEQKDEGKNELLEEEEEEEKGETEEEAEEEAEAGEEEEEKEEEGGAAAASAEEEGEEIEEQESEDEILPSEKGKKEVKIRHGGKKAAEKAMVHDRVRMKEKAKADTESEEDSGEQEVEETEELLQLDELSLKEGEAQEAIQALISALVPKEEPKPGSGTCARTGLPFTTPWRPLAEALAKAEAKSKTHNGPGKQGALPARPAGPQGTGAQGPSVIKPSGAAPALKVAVKQKETSGGQGVVNASPSGPSAADSSEGKALSPTVSELGLCSLNSAALHPMPVPQPTPSPKGFAARGLPYVPSSAKPVGTIVARPTAVAIRKVAPGASQPASQSQAQPQSQPSASQPRSAPHGQPGNSLKRESSMHAPQPRPGIGSETRKQPVSNPVSTAPNAALPGGNANASGSRNSHSSGPTVAAAQKTLAAPNGPVVAPKKLPPPIGSVKTAPRSALHAPSATSHKHSPSSTSTGGKPSAQKHAAAASPAARAPQKLPGSGPGSSTVPASSTPPRRYSLSSVASSSRKDLEKAPATSPLDLLADAAPVVDRISKSSHRKHGVGTEPAVQREVSRARLSHGGAAEKPGTPGQQGLRVVREGGTAQGPRSERLSVELDLKEEAASALASLADLAGLDSNSRRASPSDKAGDRARSRRSSASTQQADGVGQPVGQEKKHSGRQHSPSGASKGLPRGGERSRLDTSQVGERVSLERQPLTGMIPAPALTSV